ncbi:MAG: leucine-rich repeat domain-containing protein [Verrucomicrobiales bacterium]
MTRLAKCCAPHLLAGLLLLGCSTIQAGELGALTYEITGGSVTITGYTGTGEEQVAVPAEIEGLPVTAIGDSAFRSSRDIVRLTLPPSIATIGVQAFEYCNSLADINLPGRASIGRSAFGSCYRLVTIAVPDDIVAIGERAFSNCTRLERFSIPTSLTTISPGIFAGCSRLTEVVIHDRVTSLGSGCFAGCEDIRSLTLPASIQTIGASAFSDCSQLTAITIPDGVTTIEPLTFSGCNRLTTVSVPDSVSSIGREAFRHCFRLESIRIPDGVSEIPMGTFEVCSDLVTIEIPASVTTIDTSAFFRCSDLECIEVATGNTAYSSHSGALLDRDASTLLLCPAGFEGAFTIPATVTSIESNFDDFCDKLTSFEVEPGNLVYAGLGGVLVDADRAVLIRFPKGRPGHYTTPPGVIEIASSAFYNCDELRSVSISPGVVRIGEAAFRSCSRIDDLAIPPGVTRIADSAFRDCSSLTEIRLPDGVTEIGPSAFYRCESLGRVIVGASVSLIHGTAFDGLSSIQRVYFLGDGPELTSSAIFKGAPAALEFYAFSERVGPGFLRPEWGDKTINLIDGSEFPAAGWLLGHGLPHDVDLTTESGTPGVDWLTAFALQLDPGENLRAQLPVPVLDPTSLSIEFHAGSRGVSYSAETSADLKTWSGAGVSISGADANGIRRAGILRDSTRRFMRLRFALE